MRNENRATQTALAVTISCLMAGNALAQGIGNPPLPSWFLMGNPPGWLVSTANGLPIPVELDPNGPLWRKTFANPQGLDFWQWAGGPPLPIVESLLVAGDRPWTDWHALIVTPGWTWASAEVLVNGQPASGLVTTINLDTLDFVFDPIPPGSFVTIASKVAYNGPPNTAFLGMLEIVQYPTPEPATAGLLGIAGLMMARRRRA